MSDGHLYNITELSTEYEKAVGKTSRTLHNHFLWLLKNGWIERRKKGYHILGYKSLLNKIGIENPQKKGALFQGNYDDFNAFVHAAVITSVGRKKKYTDRHTGSKKKGRASGCIKYSFDIPHTYLAKVLGVSKSTAQNYRKYAEPYLDIYPLHQLFYIELDLLKFGRLTNEDETRNLVVKNEKVYEQKPSRIQSGIILKRKRL